MVKRYIELRYLFEDSIEVYEYLDGRYGAPGEKRGKRKRTTPEQIKKRNLWNRERTVRHKIKFNMRENDYLLTLTYRRADRPKDMAMAKEHFKKWYRKVGDWYKKQGFKLKWIRNIEVGPKGAWHIHVIVNRISDADLIIKKAWPHGTVTFKHLYEQGDFADLAGYITKTPETANRYNENLVETHYYTSRGLPTPEPEIKRLAYWKKEPHVPEGYYIDKNTYHEGKNDATGYKYRYCTMIRYHRRD